MESKTFASEETVIGITEKNVQEQLRQAPTCRCNSLQRRMPSIRQFLLASFLIVASFFAICSATHPSKQSTEDAAFQELLSTVNDASLHEVLHDYLESKYKDGIFPGEKTAMEAVRKEDAEMATSLIRLARRQSNATSASIVTETSVAVTTDSVPVATVTSLVTQPASTVVTSNPAPTSVSSTPIASPTSAAPSSSAVISASPSASASQAAPASTSPAASGPSIVASQSNAISTPSTLAISTSTPAATISQTSAISVSASASAAAPTSASATISQTAAKTSVSTATDTSKTSAGTTKKPLSSTTSIEVFTSTLPNGDVTTITAVTVIPLAAETSASASSSGSGGGASLQTNAAGSTTFKESIGISAGLLVLVAAGMSML